MADTDRVKKPAVFVGSSSEGRQVAEAIQELLDDVCEVTIWWQGVFRLGEGTLESLVKSLNRFDFAIMVMTPDDMTESRKEKRLSPRDNVLFELGLFIGRLGRNRTFAICDGSSELKLPSDLAGVTVATYNPRDDGNFRAALGAPCAGIKHTINNLGLRSARREADIESRMTQFFGCTLSEGIHVYLSSMYLNKAPVLPHGCLKTSYKGGALIEGEFRIVADLSRALRPFHLHIMSSPHTSASPHTSDTSRLPVPDDATIISIGSSAYNAVSRHFQNRTRLRVIKSDNQCLIKDSRSGKTFERQGEQNSRRTFDLAALQRINEQDRSVFLAEGLGVNGSCTAVRYLIDNWAQLLDSNRTDQFSIVLRCSHFEDNPSGYIAPEPIPLGI